MGRLDCSVTVHHSRLNLPSHWHARGLPRGLVLVDFGVALDPKFFEPLSGCEGKGQC